MSEDHPGRAELALTRAVADAVPVPVIASGGAGGSQHMLEALTDGHADAALAATIYHFGEVSVAETKALLASHGVPVRPLVEG